MIVTKFRFLVSDLIWKQTVQSFVFFYFFYLTFICTFFQLIIIPLTILKLTYSFKIFGKFVMVLVTGINKGNFANLSISGIKSFLTYFFPKSSMSAIELYLLIIRNSVIQFNKYVLDFFVN